MSKMKIAFLCAGALLASQGALAADRCETQARAAVEKSLPHVEKAKQWRDKFLSSKSEISRSVKKDPQKVADLGAIDGLESELRKADWSVTEQEDFRRMAMETKLADQLEGALLGLFNLLKDSYERGQGKIPNAELDSLYSMMGLQKETWWVVKELNAAQKEFLSCKGYSAGKDADAPGMPPERKVR